MIPLIHTDVSHLLHRYGSAVLFVLLALGIVGLPVPDETLLLLSGFLCAKGRLSLIAVVIAAISGSCIAITISYLLGRFVGHRAILYVGKYIGLTQEKLDAAHVWFLKFGKYLLFIGYFIPGVRHLTGIVAGTTELEYPVFAVFAYAGAIVWSLTFIFLGYFFFHELQRWQF